MPKQFTYEFIDGGREAQCPSNTKYPNGKDIDLSLGAPRTCTASDIPYPAARCGAMIVECYKCGLRIGLTVAGRRDDPRSAKLRCNVKGQQMATPRKVDEP